MALGHAPYDSANENYETQMVTASTDMATKFGVNGENLFLHCVQTDPLKRIPTSSSS